MRLQETPDEIPEGGTPHTVSLLMHDKLVDAGKPGDRVEVNDSLESAAHVHLYNASSLILLYAFFSIGYWCLQGNECQSFTDPENSKIII